MRRLAHELVKHGSVVRDSLARLFRYAALWWAARGPLSPMPQLTKHCGLELATHLDGRAFDRAFSPNQRVVYFMIAGPAATLLLTLATGFALPAGWWNPGSGTFASVLTGFAWVAVYWRLVILPKHRRALRALLLECGHCPACGRDLGDSPHRCPECAAVPGAPASTC